MRGTLLLIVLATTSFLLLFIESECTRNVRSDLTRSTEIVTLRNRELHRVRTQLREAEAELSARPKIHLITRLDGEIGSSSQWGSGWLNLASPRDFVKGDRLRLRVGGTAEKILVRLLAKGMSPDSSLGFSVERSLFLKIVSSNSWLTSTAKTSLKSLCTADRTPGASPSGRRMDPLPSKQ
jgi:hypothetical protein